VLVEAAIVRLRLAETFAISRESADWSDVVHVEIRHGDHVGRGEAAPIERYDETAESAQAFIREHAALLGDDPFALEEIGARLDEMPGEHAAKSALDAVLHDLQGKLLGVPVGRFA
jgi:L-alanine-DL-glutamate epimerase-like enolase superfamily enzyme